MQELAGMAPLKQHHRWGAQRLPTAPARVRCIWPACSRRRVHVWRRAGYCSGPYSEHAHGGQCWVLAGAVRCATASASSFSAAAQASSAKSTSSLPHMSPLPSRGTRHDTNSQALRGDRMGLWLPAAPGRLAGLVGARLGRSARRMQASTACISTRRRSVGPCNPGCAAHRCEWGVPNKVRASVKRSVSEAKFLIETYSPGLCCVC